jgi:hypothetical protein
LEDALEAVDQWDEKTTEEFDLAELRPHLVELDDAMAKAMRKGLLNHPEVPTALQKTMAEFKTTRRGHGDWDYLRDLGIGAETGVKRQLTWAEVWLENGIDSAVAVGKPPEAIRKSLVNQLSFAHRPPRGMSKDEAEKLRDRLRDMSRQCFHNILKKLGH